MEVKVGDKFIFHSANGMDYRINVISINEYREPSMRYGCDIWNRNAVNIGDVTFVGDDFFDQFKNQFERIENWNE